jgi:hypothetical protein
MFLIPLLAGLVGLVFGALVLRQFAQRRRPYQAAWGFALLLFGAAALFEAAGVSGGWTPAEYRAYYLLGGILNVGWLGCGSIYILNRRAGHAAVIVMALVTVAAVPAVVISPTDAHLLAAQVPGRGAIGAPATFFPIFTNIAGSIALIGGAAWSAWSAWRRGGSDAFNRVAGTALIAAGAFVVAGTHSFAQVRGTYAVQPVGEAAGIVLMFAGYLLVEARAPQPQRSRRTAT